MARPAQNMRGLTARQERAVQHFVTCGDMTAAYRAAGYSTRGKPATITRMAFRLFELPHVAARVQELREENAERCALTREEALAIGTRIARGALPTYLDETGHIVPAKVKALGGPDIEAFEEVHGKDGMLRRTLRLRNPIEAIARLSRMCGWDKQGSLEAEGVVINLNIGGPDEKG